MNIESPTLSPRSPHPRSSASHLSEQASSFRCSQCSPKPKENSKGSRNLIVCIDGTSNQFGQNNTNVVKLFAKIDLETSQPEQFAYYSSGIGTRPKSLHIFDRVERAVSDKFDMAVAWNMEEIVKDAYGWLAGRYREGDKIYLFGFSRGAYQVRVLAGMIHEVGLIRTSTEKQIGTAYDHYESIRSGKPKTRQIAREFKNTFSWKGLRVHFVGVWDTVSSVGLVRGDVFLSTSSSAAHACHFRHALALDELRVKFIPEYFHEMNSETDDAKSKYVALLDHNHSTTPLGKQTESEIGTLSEVGQNPRMDAKSSESTSSRKHMASIQSNQPKSTSGSNFPGVAENLRADGKTRRTSVAPGSEHSKVPSTEQHDRYSGEGSSRNENVVPDIKEVWFAGSHSDVGGRNRPGKSAQAGNVSLLWMRREAVLKGLVLQPTDVVWVPDDLDLGISDSMSRVWKCVEYFPIKHQVSFSGAGEDARRLHRSRPRRIIPGQKVHASILYANAYKPQATLGLGFDIPITQAEFDDADLGNQIWETGLFDKTAAQELVESLESQQGVAPIYLDRLLFMLRFNEGKQCVRDVYDWRKKFEDLIESHKCASLVRLVTIIAYYEASSDPHLHTHNSSQLHQDTPMFQKRPSDFAFDDAKKCLSDTLKKHKHRDGPRVVALLRPLTKHKDLRDNILSEEILNSLVDLLDKIVEKPEGNFGQAMDGLNSLLRCEDTRELIIKKLRDNGPNSRLAQILKVKDTRLQIAALRMVLTLARSTGEQGKEACALIKSRIKNLAGSSDRLVGLLAVEVWLALYDPREQEQEHLNLHNAQVRANLASALVGMNFSTHGSTDDQCTNVDPGQEQLRRIFGVGDSDANGLDEKSKKLLRKLKSAVRLGNARERIAATLTLLKLCGSESIRLYLRDINMVGVFVKQLQKKDAALLAAYALATCLNYNEMKESIRNNQDVPKYIVSMLQLDYFDDAIGQIEGFQIFGNIMRDNHLREEIKKYKIPEVLERKLSKGKPKDVRTSLICLDIFRSFDKDGSGTRELVRKSLDHLRDPRWSVQKVGVTILSALAQTEQGALSIEPCIPEIIRMLLPEGYLPILREPTSVDPTSLDERQPTRVETTAFSDSDSSLASDTFNRPPSWMMGPACALRTLAQNKTLRGVTHDTLEYGSLKHLFLSGTLVGDKDTSALRIGTPNRTDVTRMLDKMIKAVDGELSEDGLMSVGDTLLPQIRHWDRLVTVFRNRALGVVSIIPGVLGVSILAILGVVAVTPIVLSVKAYGLFGRLWTRYQAIQFLDDLHDEHGIDGAAPGQTGTRGATDEGETGGPSSRPGGGGSPSS